MKFFDVRDIFGLPHPPLRSHRYKVLPRHEGGVEEGFHRVIKDQINFVPERNEGIKNGEAREQRVSWGYDEFVHGDERGQCKQWR